MKYKVGDKVIVISNLVHGKNYFMENGRDFWPAVVGMTVYHGKEMTIEEANEGHYLLKEDSKKFAWTDEMFESKALEVFQCEHCSVDHEKDDDEEIQVESYDEKLFYVEEENNDKRDDEMMTEENQEQEVLVIKDLAQFGIFIEKVIFNNPATIMFYRVPNYERKTGKIKEYTDIRKVVAKCNPNTDVYNKHRGLNLCMLKAVHKEAGKLIKQY